MHCPWPISADGAVKPCQCAASCGMPHPAAFLFQKSPFVKLPRGAPEGRLFRSETRRFCKYGKEGIPPMEICTVLLFCGVLVSCIALGAEILYALALGLLIFAVYALKQGYSLKNICLMCAEGMKTARNVMLTFLLIGILTGMWRAAGTIPVIVCDAAELISPSMFLLAAFLLNCMVSLLTGTSFGTAATMGVICASMAEAMHLSPVLLGGAVLAGAFFGDRCSPVSTSALLVSELTRTNLYDNIKLMHKTAAVPFAVTCLLYMAVGAFTPHEAVSMDLSRLFSQEFRLHWTALLPALLILALSLFRVPVKKAMTLSILSAVPVCVFLQGMPWGELLSCAVFGYRAECAEVAPMVNGGGVVSMLRAVAIVCISSAYSGIFQKTGLLDGIQRQIRTLGEKISDFGAMMCTSVLTGAVSCNQTLAIMLAHQLCDNPETDRSTMAVRLENTAVVIAPLIPWSIASGVPLASINAPALSISCAFFLYLLPLWRFLAEWRTACRK